jgi:hypothetical protein
MNDLPGRGDVNPYGIPMPNPHEREGPDEDEVHAWTEGYPCVVCGELINKGTRCQRCNDSMEYDRLERESGR